MRSAAEEYERRRRAKEYMSDGCKPSLSVELVDACRHANEFKLNCAMSVAARCSPFIESKQVGSRWFRRPGARWCRQSWRGHRVDMQQRLGILPACRGNCVPAVKGSRWQRWVPSDRALDFRAVINRGQDVRAAWSLRG